MMSLPKAVQAQAKRAEDLQKRLKEGKPQDQPGTTPPPESGTPAPENRDTLPNDVQAPPAAPAPDQQQKTDPPKPADSEETWEQRYKSLKGKFDSQVPRLQQDNRRLYESVSKLESEVAQLKEAAAQPKPTQDQPGGDPVPELDVDGITYYGEEFRPLVETVQKLRTENDDLKGQIQKVLGEIETDRKQTAEEKYNTFLNGVVNHVSGLGADFNVLNVDRAFLNWLAQVPDGEFESRQARLKRAESNMDQEAAKEVFTEYLGSLKKPDAQENGTPPADHQPPNIQPQPSNPGSDITPPGQNEGRVWTRKMISKFYDDKKRGVFRGREDEFKALEQDLYAAQKEGRLA